MVVAGRARRGCGRANGAQRCYCLPVGFRRLRYASTCFSMHNTCWCSSAVAVFVAALLIATVVAKDVQRCTVYVAANGTDDAAHGSHAASPVRTLRFALERTDATHIVVVGFIDAHDHSLRASRPVEISGFDASSGIECRALSAPVSGACAAVVLDPTPHSVSLREVRVRGCALGVRLAGEHSGLESVISVHVPPSTPAAPRSVTHGAGVVNPVLPGVAASLLVQEESATQRAALVDLFVATNGPGWINSVRWLAHNLSYCSWNGVLCSGADVVTLCVRPRFAATSGVHSLLHMRMQHSQ